MKALLWLLFAVACVAIAFCIVAWAPAWANACDYEAAECPCYAKAVDQGGVVVITGQVGGRKCFACEAEKAALTEAGISYCEVSIDRHPLTAAVLRTLKVIPETLLIRRGVIVRRWGYATPAEISEATKP